MIKLVSSDLNGTLVHEHTMNDMIRRYIGEKEYEKASHIFKLQTNGKATMRQAFECAGPLTKGLTLRQAIEYTIKYMTYVDGFKDFLEFLKKKNILFVINSTGYSVTIYSIQYKVNNICNFIGNFLEFEDINEDELKNKVKSYFNNPNSNLFDHIKSTGKVKLGINNEEAKANLIMSYAKKLNIKPSEIMYIGDTIGDYGGIVGIARKGGMGVAFNYNKALKQALPKEKNIYFIDEKSQKSDLRKIIPLIK